jgi:hypothetical protein
MPLTQPSAVLTATLATAAVAASLALVLSKPKAHKCIPGPAGVPVLGNGLLITSYGKEFHRLWSDMDEKYGKIWAVSVGDRVLVGVRDADVAKMVFNNATDFVRSDRTQAAMKYVFFSFSFIRAPKLYH